MELGKVKQFVAEYLDVELKDVDSKKRNNDIVKARHFIMYFLYLKCTSYSAVARFMKRDHATVMHAIKSVEGQVSTNRIYSEQFNYLLNRICPEMIDQDNEFRQEDSIYENWHSKSSWDLNLNAMSGDSRKFNFETIKNQL